MPGIHVIRWRLDLAFQLAISDLEEGQTADPYRNADQDWRHEKSLDRLARTLRDGSYRPELPRAVSLPKSEFAARPGKRIELADLTVLYYIVLAFADVFEDRLRAGVTAYRVRRARPTISAGARYVLPRYLRRRHKIIDPWYDAWPKFHKKLRAEYALGRRYVGTSDITSFYEDIDLTVMRSVLLAACTKPLRPVVQLLIDIYSTWSARDVHSVGLNRGVPQGTETSGVIANYYLMPFDQAVSVYARTKRLSWYRYSDDLRLIGRDREAVRVGLRLVGEELSKLNLIQQSGKTEILTGTRARTELFDPRPDRIKLLEVRLKTASSARSRKAVVRQLDRVLLTVSRPPVKDKMASRALALLYGAYGVAGDDKLLRRWRRDILAEPQRSKTVLNYVARFLHRPRRVQELVTLIADQRGRATDWEMAMLLRTLRRAPKLPPTAPSLLLSIARGRKNNWYVRQQAVSCIGWFRLATEARTLGATFESEWDDEMRRSLLTLAHLFGHAFGESLLLEGTRDASPKVMRMANFMLALREGTDLAVVHLKRFRSPDLRFLADGSWRLYQIRRNPAPSLVPALALTLARLDSLNANPTVAANLRSIRASP